MDAQFRQYLGWERFPEKLTDEEIAGFFSLSDDERRAVHARRRSMNRLGIALQIGYLRMTGQPLNSVEMIAPRVLEYIGAALAIGAPRLASIIGKTLGFATWRPAIELESLYANTISPQPTRDCPCVV